MVAEPIASPLNPSPRESAAPLSYSYPNPLSLHSLVAAVPGLLSFYLCHLLWPARLSLFYDFSPSQTFGLLAFWIPFLLIAAILCALLWLFHRCFLHDRYFYLPILGASLLLAILLRGFFPRRALALLSSCEKHLQAGQ